LRVGLEVQALEGHDGDEQVVEVEPVAAEHAPRAHRTQRGQQFQAMLDEGGGHRAQSRSRNS
jgi:hypothetical protein